MDEKYGEILVDKDRKRCGKAPRHTPHWWPEDLELPDSLREEFWCDGRAPFVAAAPGETKGHWS
jgi:hypothetical protein